METYSITTENGSVITYTVRDGHMTIHQGDASLETLVAVAGVTEHDTPYKPRKPWWKFWR